MTIHACQGIFPKIHPTAFIHPGAVVIGDVEIGAESSVWPGVVIRGDVNRIRIGRGSNIQDGAILHVSRPTESKPGGEPLLIGDLITIGHGVVLHGCVLENGAMVGMRATVMDQVVVGVNAMVAAGALVPPGKRLAEGALWMGAPAQFRRPLSAGEIAEHLATAQNYIRLSRQYLAEM